MRRHGSLGEVAEHVLGAQRSITITATLG